MGAPRSLSTPSREPLIREAEQEMFTRLGRNAEIDRYGAPVQYLENCRFAPEMRSLCIGTVGHYDGKLTQVSIQVGRDGVVRWRGNWL